MTTEIVSNDAQGCVCWVQITQELRDYAQKHQIDEGQAAEVSANLCLHQIGVTLECVSGSPQYHTCFPCT